MNLSRPHLPVHALSVDRMELPKLEAQKRLKRLLDRHMGREEQAERWAAWSESVQRVPRPQTRPLEKIELEVNP